MPNLTGRQTFFADRITAEVRVGALSGFDRSGDGASRTAEDRPRRGGPGGGGMGGGMGRPPGEGGPGMGPGGEDSRPGTSGRPGPGRQAPPVAIHLRFTNTGTTLASLTIADFLSPLGNFVVHPSTLSLEPGQSAAVEPMASRLAGDVIVGEVTLSLRLDDTKETKTVTLLVEPVGPPVKSP